MGKWVKTFFAGGILGAFLGVLFAPEKGDKSREKLKEAINKGKDKFQDIKEQFSEKEDV